MVSTDDNRSQPADHLPQELKEFLAAAGEVDLSGISAATPVENSTHEKSEKVAHVLVPSGRKQEEIGHLHPGDIGVVMMQPRPVSIQISGRTKFGLL